MPRATKPRDTLLSATTGFRITSTENGKSTILLETANLAEARTCYEEAAKRARNAGSQAVVAHDQFQLEERMVWTQRISWSKPAPATVVRLSARQRGKARILFVPLEMALWVAARGWTYSANLAYARALAAQGHEVTVLNTEAIKYRDLIPGGGKYDQVWTHVHFRHATDHYYREWLTESAPIRVGLAGESCYYAPEEVVGSPWYLEQTRAWRDWMPFLTHCAFVAPGDLEPAKREVAKSGNKALEVALWRQAVPQKMVRKVRPPKVDKGIFVGAAYPPRDAWIEDPRLKDLLVKPFAPEGPALERAFNRTHPYLHGWMRSVGSFGALALKLYARRLEKIRRKATDAFIGAVGEGVCVVNLPSMVKAYSGRVIEGMASGRPVVTWKPEGDDELDDCVVHYGDSVEELAEAIRLLRDHPDMAAEIAERARERVLAEHTVEKRAADLVRWVTGA